MRIGILNSGGDCPGLNAVIHGVVGAATRVGWEVLGFKDGYEGLLPDGAGHVKLDPAQTAGIMKLGGTILGTTNKGHFAAKTGIDQKREIPTSLIDTVRNHLSALGVEALVLVGGDGSLTTAWQMSQRGLPVVGVPKTIDNDLQATSMTFGFDSAVGVVVDALDRLHTTAESHQRVMVVEVMGRHAGWIALYGGMAGGADIILLPEIPFSLNHVAKQVQELYATGKRSVLIVVAEGAALEDGKLVTTQHHDGEKQQVKLGGVGEFVAKQLEEILGRDVRDVRLGHLQRGGSPTSWDRILGTRFGVHAVKLIQEGKFGRMVSYQNDAMGDVSIEEAVREVRRVPADGEIVRAARSVGIGFGDR